MAIVHQVNVVITFFSLSKLCSDTHIINDSEIQRQHQILHWHSNVDRINEVEKVLSCTPDRNCHTFCLGDKIASHPGVLTQAKCAKKITQNLEINQIWGVVVQEKESNMVFFSR